MGGVTVYKDDRGFDEMEKVRERNLKLAV